MKSRGIKYKIFVLFFLILLVPTLVLGIATSIISYQDLLEQNKETLLSEVKRVGVLLEEQFKIFDRYSKMLIFDQNIQETIYESDMEENSYANWKASVTLNKYFSNYFNNPYLLALAILKPEEGLYTYADSLGLDESTLRSQPWLQETVEAKGACRWSLSPDGEYIIISRTIRDSAYKYTWDTIGYLYIAVSKAAFLDLSAESGESIDAWLVDDGGEIVFARDPQNAEPLSAQAMGNFDRKSGAYQSHQRQSFVSYYSLDVPDWYVVLSMPQEIFTQGMRAVAVYIVASCFLGMLTLLFIADLVVKRITKPLSELTQAMQDVKEGNFLVEVPVSAQDEIGIITQTFNEMTKKLGLLFHEVVQKEESKRQAEIRALRYQINPHFLYNALNSIRIVALMRNVTPIADAIACLSRLMQNAIGKYGELITLKTECQIIQDYLVIQNIRYNNRISAVFAVEPDCMDCLLPSYLLQPLVENAVFHGIEPRGEAGTVRISASCHGDTLQIEIQDNGVGMTQYQIDHLFAANQAEGRVPIGLENVRQRIEMMFGEAYGLEVQSEVSVGTRVIVRLPVSRSGGEDSENAL